MKPLTTLTSAMISPILKDAIKIALIAFFLTSCHPDICKLEPQIIYFPQERHIRCLPSPFSPLSPEEQSTDWGKELAVARAFSKELDLYRALTSYKRALIFSPPNERKLEIEYNIVLSYYLGGKHQNAVEAFEGSSLCNVPPSFPAFHELILILYDSYEKIGQNGRSCRLLELIQQQNPQEADDLSLGTAIQQGNIPFVYDQNERIDCWCSSYLSQAKSPYKAATLNALLPGAGYAYIGQHQTALTALIVNALFIAATYEFFHHGYPAAGVITGGIEMGWYLGGINGGALAAKQYNEAIWNAGGKEVMLQKRLFPVLMFNYAF